MEGSGGLGVTFKDERGRDWTIKLTVPVLYSFCKAEKISLDQLAPVKMSDGQWRLNLSVSQLLLLAYEGTRYQSRVIAKAESLEEFLEALDGPAFMNAQMAAVGALVSFFLKTAPGIPSPGERSPECLGTGAPSSV